MCLYHCDYLLDAAVCTAKLRRATLTGAHGQVLAKNPADRLSLDAVMRHPWIAPCSPLPPLPRRPSQVRLWQCSSDECMLLAQCRLYYALQVQQADLKMCQCAGGCNFRRRRDIRHQPPRPQPDDDRAAAHLSGDTFLTCGSLAAADGTAPDLPCRVCMLCLRSVISHS
jgi:hypothetical protein